MKNLSLTILPLTITADLSNHVEWNGIPVAHREITDTHSLQCARSGFHVGIVQWFARPLGR